MQINIKFPFLEKKPSQIANYIKGKKVNIFNDGERSQLIRELAKITNIHTAKEVNQIIIINLQNKE